MTGRGLLNTRVLTAIVIFAGFNVILARLVHLACGADWLTVLAVDLPVTGGLLSVAFLGTAVIARTRQDLAERLEERLMLALGWAVSIAIGLGIVVVLGRLLVWIWRVVAG